MSAGPYEQWKSSTIYLLGNTVQYLTSIIYQCIQEPCLDIPPPNLAYWMEVAPPAPPTTSAATGYYALSTASTLLSASPASYLSITVVSVVNNFATVSSVFSFINLNDNIVNNFVRCQIYINGSPRGIEMSVCPTNIAYENQNSQIKVEYGGSLGIGSNIIQLVVYCDTGVGIQTLNGTLTVVSGLTAG